MKTSVIVLLVLALFAGILLGNYMQENNKDNSIGKLQLGENTITLDFRNNRINISNETTGEYVEHNSSGVFNSTGADAFTSGPGGASKTDVKDLMLTDVYPYQDSTLDTEANHTAFVTSTANGYKAMPEHEANNGFEDGDVNEWYINPRKATPSIFEANSTYPVNDSYSMKFKYPGDTGEIVNKTCIQDGKVTVSFYINHTQRGGSEWDGLSFSAYRDPHTRVAHFFKYESNGDYCVAGQDPYGSWNLYQTYSNEVVIYLDNNTYDVYWNGTKVASNESFDITTNYITEFRFGGNGNNGAQTAYIDWFNYTANGGVIGFNCTAPTTGRKAFDKWYGFKSLNTTESSTLFWNDTKSFASPTQLDFFNKAQTFNATAGQHTFTITNNKDFSISKVRAVKHNGAYLDRRDYYFNGTNTVYINESITVNSGDSVEVTYNLGYNDNSIHTSTMLLNESYFDGMYYSWLS